MTRNILMTGLILLCFNFFAQSPGDNDPSFNAPDFGFGTGDGPNGNIFSSAIQSDGKVIVGGNFTDYNGRSVNSIARLNSNGTLDSSFAAATAPNTLINSVLIQPDGKIIIAGYHSNNSAPIFQGIKRLNIDGSADNSFVGSIEMYSEIKRMILQPDGKIIIVGNFTTYNGATRNNISRLNTDGSLDMSFLIGSGADYRIDAVIQQPDGKIVIGGYFTNYNGTTVNRIARLNSNGSLDGTFNVGSGLNSVVTAIGIQPNGKILVSGVFTTYNSVGTGGLIRLDVNGTLDGTFTPIAGDILSIIVQTDGRIIIAGDFLGLNGLNTNRIARINSDGTTDASFNIGSGADQLINSTILQPDGKVIIAGNFSTYNSLVRNKITRLNMNASLDLTFVAITGANSAVNKIVLESTGSIAVGGNFTSVNGVNKNHIARFNASGVFVQSYPSGNGTNGNIYAMGTQQSTDKTIVAAGNFYQYNGNAAIFAVIGINPTFGTLNSPWLGSWGWDWNNSSVYTLGIHNDGKIVFGGSFQNYDGTVSDNIGRIYNDGSPDQLFIGNASANDTVRAIAVQANGKTLAGGDFTVCSGISANRITRLNTDGTSDLTFTVGLGANNTVNAIAIQPNGKILIGGNFTLYNGVSSNRIARLNTDGTLDSIFTPGVGANNTIKTIALQSDGKILIGGNFTNYNGVSRNCLARLNSDGTLDSSFIVGSGANGIINTIAISANDNILIGGDFTSYNGAGRNRIAQVYACITPTIANTTPAPALSICNGSNTKLTANSLGIISWYASITSTVVLAVGNTYITPALSTGTYTYYAEATSCSNASQRLAMVVTVSALTAPVITVNSGSVCPSTSFVILPSGGTSYTYSSGSATVTPVATSYYYVTGKGANGCTNVVTSTVTVHPRPLITVNSGLICSGSSFTIVPSGASTYTYSGGSAVVSPSVNSIYSVTGTSTLGCTSASASVSYVMVGSTLSISVSNGTICSGDSFTISPIGAPSYSYSSGSAVVTPMATTIYGVTGSSGGSCIDTKTLSVTVNASPTYTLSALSATTTCLNPTAGFSIATGDSFNWSGPGAISPSTISPSIIVTAGGVYSVIVNNSLCSITKTVEVIANTVLPFVNIAPTTLSLCEGDSTTISANVTPSTSVSYLWDNSATTQSISVSPTLTTIYTTTITNYTNGCYTSNSTTVSVYALPSLTIAGTNTVCLGTSTDFIASGAITYTWSATQTTSSININPTTTTTYTVWGTDINGCINTQIDSVTVYDFCTDVWPGDANSDGIADNLDVLELGLHYQQTGSGRVTASNNWQPYFADNWVGTITNGKNMNHSDCSGDGTINDDDTLAIYNNYGLTHTFKPAQTNTVNSQLSIVPDQAMVAKGTWGTASIFLGDATTSINSINGIAFTVDFDNTLIESNSIYIEYQNSFMDASQNLYFRKLDFANSKLFTASTHTVSNNANGFGKIATLHYQILSSLASDQVLNIGLSQANQSDASGVISPLTSGTGTLMAIGASVGIKETSINGNVFISPNPTNGLLNVNFSSLLQNTKIELYNSIGALVLTEAMSNKNNAINMSNFSSGIYFMKVIEVNKVIAVKKVVKE